MGDQEPERGSKRSREEEDSDEQHRHGKLRSRSHHEKKDKSGDYRDEFQRRERQWQTVGSSDDDDGGRGGHRDDRRSSGSSDDGDSSASSRSSRSGESASSSSRGRKHKKEKKAHKHSKSKKEKKEKKKKHKKEKKSHKHHSKSHGGTSIDQSEFGKFGIIREDSFFQKQREFEAYMEEVKGIGGVLMLPKREMMEHFKSFMEDYNTATMPHEKFYNYERWELAQYQAKKSAALRSDRESEEFSFANDEIDKRMQHKYQKKLQEEKEFNDLRAQMSADKDKRDQMRRQAELNTELQIAYKRGDMVTVKRLEKLLTPEVGKPMQKHPWL